MSNNLWGDLNNLEEIKNPLDILKEQSGYLMDATNNIIYGDLKNRKPQTYVGEPDCEFACVYSIKSKMMESYEFELFTIYYDITFYPMHFEIDENILEEIGVSEYVMVDNEKKFIELLKKILDNKFTKTVISSLYTMSK